MEFASCLKHWRRRLKFFVAIVAEVRLIDLFVAFLLLFVFIAVAGNSTVTHWKLLLLQLVCHYKSLFLALLQLVLSPEIVVLYR